MNIMIAVTNISSAYGGVTTHIIDLCRELSSRNINTILVAEDKDCDYIDKINELKNDFFKFYSVPMGAIQSNPKRLLECTRTICKIIKTENIDIMHVHSQSLCVVGALVKLKTGVPYIWTNHVDAADIANPRLFKKILKVLRFPIISVSTDLKKMLINDYDVKEKRISVVNNGIDIGRFDELSDEEKIELKRKYGCEGKYVIGLLARINRDKGHIYLLKALDQIQRTANISNIKVLIAGKVHENEKGYLEEIQSYAKDHNIDMLFLGFSNPRDVFGICDISVLPSMNEGFPLTVIESLAMGCPVIRSNTPGWEDTKEIALVFEKANVDKLAEYISYAYNNPDVMNKMSEEGRKKVFERFTIKIQVDETLKVYSKYLK